MCSRSHAPWFFRLRLFRLLVLVLPAWPLLSLAAPAETLDELMELSLEELMQVRVTGSTDFEETLQSAPSTVTVINRQDIQRLGLTRLEDLLPLVPGFQGYRGFNGNRSLLMSVRGRRVNSGREILILLDGIRLNSDINGSALTEMAITLDNVERVEFIRGPGSALYGSNAVTGVINIVTGQWREAALTAGTQDSAGASLQWQQPLDGKGYVAVLARGDRSAGESVQVYDRVTRTRRQTRDPSSGQDLYLSGEWYGWRLHARHNRRDSEDFYVNESVSPLNAVDARNHAIDLGYLHDLGTAWQLDGHVFFLCRDMWLKDWGSPPFFNRGGNHIAEEEQGAELQLRYQGDSARWLGGVEYRSPRLTDSHYFLADPGYVEFDLFASHQRDILGLYTQYQRALGQSFDLTLGLRHDDYDNVGEHQSPRLALIYHPDAGSSLKLLYGEAFRAPTPTELSLQNVTGRTANPALEPEVARTLELTWLQQMEHGYWQLAAFGSRFENAIYFTTTTPTRPENSGEESVAGLEAEWSQQWGPHWLWRINATWIADEAYSDVNSEADRLLGGSVSYLLGQWTLSATVAHAGQREQRVQVTSADPLVVREFQPYAVTDLSLRYAARSNWWALLRISNALDEDYSVPSSGARLVDGLPGRGPAAELTWHWNLD